jgi:hypothetical protein
MVSCGQHEEVVQRLIAADGSGNLFVAGPSNTRIVKGVPAGESAAALSIVREGYG